MVTPITSTLPPTSGSSCLMRGPQVSKAEFSRMTMPLSVVITVSITRLERP